MDRVKQSNHPVGIKIWPRETLTDGPRQANVRRIVEDTERRLNIFFDGLNNDTVPNQAVAQMTNIAQGEWGESGNLRHCQLNECVKQWRREMRRLRWRCTSSC